MYFLSEEERSFVAGRLLPEARQHGVHPELRGWSWQQPPLSPVYDVRLGVHEIAGKYCGSGRDVYLRRLLGIRALPNQAMREGAALHRALAAVIVRAKGIIYEHGPDGCVAHLAAVAEPEEMLWKDTGPEAARAVVAPIDGRRASATLVVESGLREKVGALVAFERQRILSRVEDVLAREPEIGADALATLALPVSVERRLNGLFLGLAGHLAADAAGTFEGLVFDVKFGARREFHRLATAAYALVMGSLYGYPIEVGCLVYVRFAGERVLVERDLHVVDDELRQWFIEERDERTRIVSEEIDPGKADDCAETCPYRQHCPGR